MRRIVRCLVVVALVGTVAGPSALAHPASGDDAARGAPAARSDALPTDAGHDGPSGDPAARLGGISCATAFVDVNCHSAFAGAIAWMAADGLSHGFEDGTFRPATTLTRQALAAFLFGLEGAPDGPWEDPPFDDVGPEHPFATPIAWMAETGVADGYDDGTFRPGAPVTRQALAAFLYRLAGSPDAPWGDPPMVDHDFTDVRPDHPFTDAVTWASAAGVTVGYPDGTFRPGEAATRRAVAALLFRIAVQRSIDGASAHRCEFLDPDECLLVWPSDHLTVEDPDTDTGRRLALDAESLPANGDGIVQDPTDLNRSDGFSPGTPVLVQVPDLDAPATALGDLTASQDPEGSVIVIDAETHEQHLLWAEPDSGATEPGDQVLQIRPAVNFEEGRRYIVALRGLRDGAGDIIEPDLAFRAYRDRAVTGHPAIEARRPHMDAILDTLDAAGHDPHDLYLAWDFTVASQRSLSERMLHLRDDAFADLGDDAPSFVVTGVEELTVEQDDRIARRVEGTFEVPLYLTGTGTPGTAFAWDDHGLLPERNGTFTARFSCRVPRTASADQPARLSLYGHGLLGGRGEVNAGNVRSFAHEHNITFCATDWIGMASEDIVNVAGILLGTSGFETLADRVQQGILNTLFLGRLMIHDDGFASHPGFRDGAEPLIDTSDLFYDGNSQGAIIGGAATAVAQDWTRAVLGVGGMNYSTLLRRSDNWPTYEGVMNAGFPRRLDQTLVLAIIQNQWDRAETNGYAAHLTTDPYPDTPEHQVLMHIAYADWQVSMWAAEVQARTSGVVLRQPALDDGRHPDANPYVGLEPLPGDGYTGSVMVYWDSGTPPPPTTDTFPIEGSDPHARPRNQATARTQKSAFFDGTFVDVCGSDPCLAP